VDLSDFPVTERILPGPPRELTGDLRHCLHGLLHRRTVELAAFLRDRLGLEPPPAWRATLEPVAGPEPAAAEAVFDRAGDHLAALLAQEESYPTAQRAVASGYRGHAITFARGGAYAHAESLGRLWPDDLDEPERQRLLACGALLFAPTLAGVKERVDQAVFEATQARLREAGEHIAGLERRLAAAEQALHQLHAQVVRLRPWHRRLGRAVRGAWRSLAALRAGRRQAIVAGS
jgi:hypothetical protein